MMEILTVKQVAERLGVTTSTVRNYHNNGLLPFQVKGKKGLGEIRLTSAEDVAAFQKPTTGRKRGVK